MSVMSVPPRGLHVGNLMESDLKTRVPPTDITDRTTLSKPQ